MKRLEGKTILSVEESRDIGVHVVTFVTNDGVFEFRETDISGDLFVTFKEIKSHDA